jgi:PTS system nitrogen regulatory IIA component
VFTHDPAPSAAEGDLDLAAAIERGGVHRGVQGTTPHEVLRSASLISTLPEQVDRDLLHRALVEREGLCSTALGNGVAVPHPREPLTSLRAPHVFLCFLETGVDFGAADGRAVSVLFVVLSPSSRQHVRLLWRLSAVLHDVALRHLLRVQAPASAIISLLKPLEAAIPPR